MRDNKHTVLSVESPHAAKFAVCWCNCVIATCKAMPGAFLCERMAAQVNVLLNEMHLTLKQFTSMLGIISFEAGAHPCFP